VSWVWRGDLTFRYLLFARIRCLATLFGEVSGLQLIMHVLVDVPLDLLLRLVLVQREVVVLLPIVWLLIEMTLKLRIFWQRASFKRVFSLFTVVVHDELFAVDLAKRKMLLFIWVLK
jgi:hypothetical protein